MLALGRKASTGKKTGKRGEMREGKDKLGEEEEVRGQRKDSVVNKIPETMALIGRRGAADSPEASKLLGTRWGNEVRRGKKKRIRFINHKKKSR